MNIPARLERLRNYLALPDSWDGYGSPPLTQEAYVAAATLVDGWDTQTEPWMACTTGGGVVFEWENCSIEVLPDGSVEVERIHGIFDRSC